MRRCAALPRAATPALLLLTLLLTAPSVLADPLRPVRLRVSGKEVALRPPAVYDGREVYAPLDSLKAFGGSYVLTRREETALVTLPGLSATEIALARPGRQPMLPLSALAPLLKADIRVHEDVCEVRRSGDPEPRESRVERPEPKSGTAAARPTPPAPSQPAESPNSAGPREPVKIARNPAPPPRPEDPSNRRPGSPSARAAQQTQAPEDPADRPPSGLVAAPNTGQTTPVPPPTVPVKISDVRPAPVSPVRITGVMFETVNDGHARLRIETDRKATASATLLSDPTRLALDVPNSTLDAGQDTWPVEHAFLSAIHAVPGESPGVTRFVLDLERLISYRIALDARGITLHLGLPRGAGRKMQDLIVVVDAGHGGNATGCRWPLGGGACILEKTLTLAIAQKVRERLEAEGVHVLMTRDSDHDVGLTSRPMLANDNNADMFISIHIDYVPGANRASGTTTYYHMNDSSSRALAQSLIGSIARVSGLPSRGARSDGVLYASGLAVLRHSRVPATLVEVGYLNHARDRARLVSADFQQTVAQAITDGIRGYVEGALPEEALGLVKAK